MTSVLGQSFVLEVGVRVPENEQRGQNRKAVAVNAVVKPQELPPCYTRLCLRQRSTGVTEKAVPLGPPCLPRLVVSLKRTCLKQQPWGQSEKKKKSPVWGADAPDPPEQVASLSTAPAADKFTSPRPTRGLTSKHDAGRKTVGDWSIGGRVRREKELRGGRATLCAALLFCG